MVGEGGASSVEAVGELVDGLERPVGDGLVGERPETLGRLQFGCVGGQEAELDAVRQPQLAADVPACVVEHEDDGLVWPGAGIAGEGVEHLLEQGDADAVGHPPLDVAGGGPHEAVEVEPLVLVAGDRDRAPAAPGPHPADQRLQAEPVLVERPDLDRPARRGRRAHRVPEFFLKAAQAVSSAAFSWRGRGRCAVKSSRCR